VTYTELEAAVISWLNRNNFAALEAEVPVFFELAQNRIDRDPDFKMVEAMKEVTITTDVPTVPADFNKGVSYTIPSLDGHALTGSSVKDVKARQGASGIPNRIAPVGTDFIFSPVPSGVYSVEIVYHPKLQHISTTTATNVLSDTHPALILFAVLLEACLWLKDDVRAAVWEGRYQTTMNDISVAEEYKRYEGGSLKPIASHRGGFESVRYN
jgi:hypothetical protein